MKLNIKTKVVHSKSRSAWNVVNEQLGGKYKIATVPYVSSSKGNEIDRERIEAFDHASFISSCFNNHDSVKDKPSSFMENKDYFSDEIRLSLKAYWEANTSWERETIVNNAFRLIDRLIEYNKLLSEELDDIAPIAVSHGWQSKFVEKGKELRADISILRFDLSPDYFNREEPSLLSDCCMSPDIVQPDLEMAEQMGSMWRVFTSYICKKCGSPCNVVQETEKRSDKKKSVIDDLNAEEDVAANSVKDDIFAIQQRVYHNHLTPETATKIILSFFDIKLQEDGIKK